MPLLGDPGRGKDRQQEESSPVVPMSDSTSNLWICKTPFILLGYFQLAYGYLAGTSGSRKQPLPTHWATPAQLCKQTPLYCSIEGWGKM